MRNHQIDPGNTITYATQDIGLAKYLLTKGFTPIVSRNNNDRFHIYTFIDSEELQTERLLYESGKALVNPLAYDAAANRIIRVQREGGIL
jgi:hypothetical protein